MICECRTALQHEIATLNEKVENLKKELAAADEKVKNADKRAKEELKSSIEAQVAETLKAKQKELDETQARLQAKEWEVKQQVLDVTNQLQYRRALPPPLPTADAEAAETRRRSSPRARSSCARRARRSPTSPRTPRPAP